MIVAQRKITTKVSEGYSIQKLVGGVEALDLNDFCTSVATDITRFSDCSGVISVHSSSSLFHSSVTVVGFFAVTLLPSIFNLSIQNCKLLSLVYRNLKCS